MQNSQAPVKRPFWAATVFAVTSNFARVRGSRILRETPHEIVRNLEIARASRYSPTDQYDPVPEIPLVRGSEGAVSVQKSRRTGNLFVVKYTNHSSRTAPRDASFARHIIRAHPNIVVVHDFFDTAVSPGRYYIYMAACTGGDLLEQITFWHHRRNRQTPRLFLYHAIVQILDIMAYIHCGLRYTTDGFYTQDPDHTPIVHGDLKPEQFFLDWSEQTGGMPNIVLGDFGHAKLMTDQAFAAGGGTRGWWAPEHQARYDADVSIAEICKAYNPACDMYVIGLVIYATAVQQIEGQECLWNPGQDEDTLALSREHGLRDIVYACLRVDPKGRASASFDKPNGILELTNNMRKVRDKMIASGRGLEEIKEPTDWHRPAR